MDDNFGKPISLSTYYELVEKKIGSADDAEDDEAPSAPRRKKKSSTTPLFIEINDDSIGDKFDKADIFEMDFIETANDAESSLTSSSDEKKEENLDQSPFESVEVGDGLNEENLVEVS